MAGFLDRAKEQAQRGLAQGKEKMEVVQAQRTGSDLLRKLGAAYYSEQREGGSRSDVEQAMTALEQHIAQYGKDFLKNA